MAYREISLPAKGETTCTFEYVIGRWNTKIKGIGIFDNHLIGTVVGNPEDGKVSVTPKNIERAILMSPLCPPHVKKARDWDKPSASSAKKIESISSARGFENLIGIEIWWVTLDEQNRVILHGTDGSKNRLDAYVADRGEPILTHCTQIGMKDPSYG